MSQKGRGIFLGKPIGTPTGLFIGKPGLMIFRGTGGLVGDSFVLDLTAMIVDLTQLQVQLNG